MLEYSYSGHESITIEFHKTFKKKVILYLILNKSTENIDCPDDLDLCFVTNILDVENFIFR